VSIIALTTCRIADPQGNILVTQHLVRLVLLQTRDQLFAQLAMLTQIPVQNAGLMAGVETVEAAEDIACELLDGLNSLPVECVATNGPSLVQKGEIDVSGSKGRPTNRQCGLWRYSLWNPRRLPHRRRSGRKSISGDDTLWR
jgi:hypothetical protein